MYGYGLNPDCHFGDHTWRGGGVCVFCGTRLRCFCGQFVREDSIEDHLDSCRWLVTVSGYPDLVMAAGASDA